LGYDLADIYTGRMTLRQLWVRLGVLAEDPKSPFARAMYEAQAEAQALERAAALDDVHTRYRK
jgi:hypothetical protein